MDEDGDNKTGCTKHQKRIRDCIEEVLEDMSQEQIQQWILHIIRHIQIVILLEGDNKYKEGPFAEGEVARETREWLDVGAFEWDFTENTI